MFRDHAGAQPVTGALENVPVALVDDDDDLRHAVAQSLGLAGCRVTQFSNAPDALRMLDESWAGVVVSDVRMPGMTGVEFFRRLRDVDPELPVVLVTAHGNIEMAVDALKAGAWDFLTKPFAPEALLAAVERAARARTLVLDNRRLQADARAELASMLIGDSPAIARLRGMIPALAQSDLDILVEGETGTGKELFARMLHRSGKRSRHRLLSVSCAAMPQALEDELFSASGRTSLVAAHRGTLILDDLDLASPQLQARLVPVIEDRVLVPSGGRDPVPLDIRVIASAGTGPARLEDRIAPALFYRVAAVHLTMPPLRDRREDIPALFAHHIGQAAGRLKRPIPGMTRAVQEHLQSHDWPGNVRELAHFAERCVLGLADERSGPRSSAPVRPLIDRLEDFERRAIVQAIRDAHGEIGQAIAALGLPRKTFYYRVKKLNIDLNDLKRPGPGGVPRER